MFDNALASAMLDALRPPPIVSPRDFAEANIRLPANAAARPGPLRLAPYQIEPLNHFAEDQADTVVLKWAAQTGKSTVVNALVGYIIACAPGPAMHVSPTETRSKEYVRERLDGMIAASPTLRALVGKGNGTRKGSTGGADNVSLKQFNGGLLAFASSHMADSLRARAIRWLLLDEVDGYIPVLKNEGDPVALAFKRTKTFEDNGRRVLLVSTPTTRAGSRIDAWYKRGDQRCWHVTCSDCGHIGPLAFEDIKWEPGKPDSAHHVCPDCGVVHDEAQRRAMVENGKWVPTATGEKGIRSYHLTELSSIFSTMASVVQQFEAATTPELKQTFYNTVLAEAYDATVEVELFASELQQRAERIVPPYRADILFITAGIDVQGNRVECTLLAHHVDKTFSVLNHSKFMGNTSGDVAWRQLDEAMGMTFPLEDGRKLPVTVQAVDSGGHSADQVIEYVRWQRRKSRSCYAIKGYGGDGRPSLKEGGRLLGQLRLMIVGVDGVKHSLQKALSLSDSTASGYIRLPAHLDDDYFEGLASEEFQIHYVRGVPRHAFVPKRGIRNEPFDCLVYAMAIAKRVPPQTVMNPTAPTPTNPPPSFEELAKRMNALSQPTRGTH